MSDHPLARRSFLSQVGAGLTIAGAAAGGQSSLSAQTSERQAWQPSKHAQDDWLDQLPGKHRIVFDTTTPGGLENALLYANNYFIANQNAYGLKDSDLAVVIVVRHSSTVFGYNDAIWAKYGTVLSSMITFVDPKTKQVPATNIYGASGDTGLEALSKRGVRLAVCQMATRYFAGGIAEKTGSQAGAVYDELASNLVATARLVPAGIVAINRAQERGYSFATTG